jgi:hypothetical protein
MRILSMLFLAAAVSGCASDGHGSSRRLSFNCSGAGKGWDDCSKQADTQCGANGYAVVARNIDSVSTASGTNEMKRELVVTCK